jgi:uncharacterized protein (TIGR02118 family)
MIKVAWLVRRRPGIDRTEFRRIWNQDHAGLVREVPGVERYLDNEAVAIAEGPGAWRAEPVIDSIACTWWTDRDALDTGLRSAQWRAVRDHAREIVDNDWAHSGRGVEVAERIMRVGPGTPWAGADVDPAMCKHVGVLYFRPDLSRNDASAHWINVHGALALEIPEILYYVQNHGVRPVSLDGADGDVFPFDGFSEVWFTDRDTFERAHESPAWLRLRDDSPNVFDVDAIEAGVNCVVVEHVIKD